MAGLLKKSVLNISKRYFSVGRALQGHVPSRESILKRLEPHNEKGIYVWKNLFFLVCIPTIGLCMFNCYTNEHPPRPEFVAYEHLRIRNRKFPWGDGNHSFFHNPHTNALPDGYETDDPHHH